MQNRSCCGDSALLARPAGSAQNPKNLPNSKISDGGPKLESSVGVIATHQPERSKTKQIRKILTTKARVFRFNPDRKVGFRDQSPGNNNVGAVDINDRVSDYISRAKGRIMRTVTNIGGGKVVKKVEKEHAAGTNHFADYINRTKMKFRSTSTVGEGTITTPK